MNHHFARLGALALAAFVLAACGGAELAPEAPAAPPLPPTPEGAMAALDRAEADITRILGAPGSYAEAPRQPGALAPSAAPPPTAGRAEPVSPAPADRPSAAPSGDKQQHGEAPAAAPDPCHVACTALASMERAADHLCGLAGAADTRCEGARTRVKNAAARVKASCPTCTP